ncbi:hypothetical protein C8R46DRAFT_1075549 [Mycena filopes]|nr:hypothetical protein C8R46DRAFT_1075549 [Mycena filopes]
MPLSRVVFNPQLNQRFFSVSRALSIPRTRLPDAPPRPLPLPFHSVRAITQAQLDHYVAPLYERNWSIFTEMPNMILNNDFLVRSARTVSMLGKKFWFLRSRGATKFLVDVAEVARQEQHEPRITLFLGRRKQHVVVRMHTAQTLGDAEGVTEADIRPGLSSLDLRLAIWLENHFQEKYVQAAQALPLPALSSRPVVPKLDKIHRWEEFLIPRAKSTIKADRTWAPSPPKMSPLPPLLADERPDTVCTDAHFETFLQPLYIRGWHAAFVLVMGEDKMYAPVLCLTGFFRFKSLPAAVLFIRDVVNYPWYKEDNAELHFLVDAQTVRAQLVYPSEHIALTLGNLRAALRIERVFRDKHLGAARMSDVHPYRNSRDMQPQTVAELQRTRQTPLRPFHLRHNAKMGQMRGGI